ncbi:MAG: glycosyltransferase [Lachnospiraceae bacterium]|nr:glycosyltransferase [Lachnospiraceae bacterium]
MKKTIIVMPVANEEATMGKILDEILALPYDNLYIYPVIDSYSKDRTEEIIRNKAAQNEKVKCIFYKESKGVISCYLEGFRQALADGAERILEMDGGGSHLPSEIPQFLQRLDEGYDCVWGSRFMKGGSMREQPLYRRILSQGGTFLANLVLGTKLKDMTSGFEGFQREVLENMNLDAFLSMGHMYQTEMRFYCRKLRTIEVPIHYVGSASSLKSSSVTEALRLLFQLKRNEPNLFGGCDASWKRLNI